MACRIRDCVLCLLASYKQVLRCTAPVLMVECGTYQQVCELASGWCRVVAETFGCGLMDVISRSGRAHGGLAASGHAAIKTSAVAYTKTLPP